MSTAIPILEMIQLVESGAIERGIPTSRGFSTPCPPPSRRGQLRGQVLLWPFLLEVHRAVVNADLVEKAGLDRPAPANWDVFLATRARSGIRAAPFGLVFDFHAAVVEPDHALETARRLRRERAFM